MVDARCIADDVSVMFGSAVCPNLFGQPQKERLLCYSQVLYSVTYT